MQAEDVLYRIQYILVSHDPALQVQCSHTKRDRAGGADEGPQSKRGKNDDETTTETTNENLLRRIQVLEAENKRINDMLSAVKEELKCAVCMEPSADDVLLECGHNFCRVCVTQWRNSGRTAGRECSLCRKPTRPANQLEHLAFRRVVEAVKYTKVYDNGEKYTGELQNEKRHGQGTCFYPNGNKYEGGWKEDSMFGQGVYTWKGGSVYRGEFVDVNKSARGVMTWANGDTYEGTWKSPNSTSCADSEFLFFDSGFEGSDDWPIDVDPINVYWYRFGDGVHTKQDGRRWQAKYDSNGRKFGFGEVTWPNGDRLTSKGWHDNTLEDVVAEYVWHDGCKLFEANLDFPEGQHDAYFCNNDISSEPRFDRNLKHHAGSYKGTWYGSDWNGHGKLTYPLINFEYEGDFLESDKHGHGKAKYGDGSTYEGEWQDDMKQGRGVYTWQDGKRYEGQFSGNQKNGQGIQTWPDGQTYEGEWQDEAWHGQGKLTRTDGSSYEGTWNLNSRHGHGKAKNTDGSTYEGNWQQDKMHGFGTKTWKDGSSYEGTWDRGSVHGHGKAQNTDGSTYEGDWRFGKMHGFGVKTWTDGSKYEGEWQYGQMHGEGTKTFNDGTTYVGGWQNNKKHGQGKATGKRMEYKGEWKQGVQHGAGTETYGNGRYYRGQFQNGKREGKGHSFDAELGEYDGEWHDGRKEGKGTLTWPNHDKYEGQFEKDTMHGQGTMRYANGDQYEGGWARGTKQGKGKMTPAGGGAAKNEIWHKGKRLPDASSLDTDQRVTLISGLPPEVASEVLGDLLYPRVLEENADRSDKHTAAEAKNIVEFIIAARETYEIVNILRDKRLFSDAFLDACSDLESLCLARVTIGVDYEASDLTVAAKLATLEKWLLGKVSLDNDIMKRLAVLEEQLED